MALQVAEIIASITAKKDWQGKVRTESIVQNWRREAQEQHVTEELFNVAINELRSMTPSYLSNNGIAYRDNLLPPQLVAALRHELDKIFAKASDIQPNTGGTMVNLIQPSLYSFVEGESYLTSQRAPPPEVEQVLMLRRTEASRRERFSHCMVNVKEESKFRWLPAEVDVDAQGMAQFRSHINNAPEDPGFYQAMGQTLSCLLPMMEQVVTPPGARTLISLKNRRLQVVVKAANCVLKPGESYEGGWHVEGMHHERIVATGLVYYDASQFMQGEGLAFRRLKNRNIVNHPARVAVERMGDYEGDMGERRVQVESQDGDFVNTDGSHRPDPEEEEEMLEYANYEDVRIPTGFVQPKYSLTGENIKPANLWTVNYKSHQMPNNVDLGTIATPVGRCLVFKNSLQHKVKLLWNSSDTETAHRKVIAFWLVDPDVPILSTADCPDQHWDQTSARLGAILARQWNPTLDEGTHLDRSTVTRILEFAKWGFSHDEALAFRADLMRDRAIKSRPSRDAFEKIIKREYSFCEH